MDLRELVQWVIKAPSGHNAQPWQFKTSDQAIRILPDLRRRLPVVDPDDHALFISLGCALENLMVAANHFRLDARVELFPSSEPEECIMVWLSPKENRDEDRLFPAIVTRQSNRGPYDGRPIPAIDLETLQKATKQESVRCQMFVGSAEVEPLIPFILEGTRRQYRDKAFVRELVSWIRFNRAEAKKFQDGLYALAMGAPAAPRWLGTLFMTVFTNPESMAHNYSALARGSSALALFIASKNDKSHWVQLGRSFQRFALTATSLGISSAHLNMPCEVLAVRKRLQEHLRLGEAQPLLLLRLGYGKPVPYSLRRPTEQVLLPQSA
jgi:hypothetical protein